MSTPTDPTTRRRRFTPVTVITGVLAAFLIALSGNPTMAGFVASITNDTNTAGTGYLSMQEANGAGTVLCNSTDGAGGISTNSATCSTINKYGGNMSMVPGQSVTTPVTIKNTGNVAANTFTLTPGACTQTTQGSVSGTATDLCAKLNIVIKSGTTTVWSGTAAALATGGAIDLAALGLAPVPAGNTVPFTVAVTLDASAGAAYQGLVASQPLTWTFGS